MSQVALLLVIVFFAGVILLMMSKLGPCAPVTVYKYLPRDLDTYLREEPPVSVTEARVFFGDDWSDVTGGGSLGGGANLVQSGNVWASTGVWGASNGTSNVAVSALGGASVSPAAALGRVNMHPRQR